MAFWQQHVEFSVKGSMVKDDPRVGAAASVMLSYARPYLEFQIEVESSTGGTTRHNSFITTILRTFCVCSILYQLRTSCQAAQGPSPRPTLCNVEHGPRWTRSSRSQRSLANRKTIYLGLGSGGAVPYCCKGRVPASSGLRLKSCGAHDPNQPSLTDRTNAALPGIKAAYLNLERRVQHGMRSTDG